MRPLGTAEELERRRRRAVALVEQGNGIRQAAKAVGAAPGSVSQWYAEYLRGGSAALVAKVHPGRPANLTGPQCKRLLQLLQKGPLWHGYTTELWTLGRVAQVIEKYWSVSYDPSGVWHLLHRLGWSCQKPERQARERDEQVIQTWRKKEWPRIKKRST